MINRGRLPGERVEGVTIDTGEDTIVQQQFKDEVDINTIVRRFGLGQLPAVGPVGVYGDFTGINDYSTAVAAVSRADESFSKLDPKVREKFGNDPARFLDFAARHGDEELMAFVGLHTPVVLAPRADGAPDPAALTSDERVTP